MAHPWHDVPRGKESPDAFNAIIEIRSGGKVKYELDKDTGLMRVDRVLHSSVIYPANYGFIPQSYGDDKDPLDVLVIAQEPVEPMCIVRARGIGMMKMVDDGQNDAKIISVAMDDPAVSGYWHIKDLPEHQLNELGRFFQDYKKLEDKEVQVEDFFGPERAREVVADSFAHYDEKIRPTLEGHTSSREPEAATEEENHDS